MRATITANRAFSRRWRRSSSRLLTLKGGERILDVGCGDGKITAEIAARVPRGSVLGVDPSRDMIAFASSHFGPPAQTNLRFEVADVRQFALPERIRSRRFLQRPPLGAGARAGPWLDPRSPEAGRTGPGTVCLRRHSASASKTSSRRYASGHAGPTTFTGFQKPYVHFTPEEYRALAERGGFQVLRLHVEDKAWDFKTREAFVAFARATFVEWTRHVPQSEWDAFITDVLDRYQSVAADNPQEANTFKFYQMEVGLKPLQR